MTLKFNQRSGLTRGAFDRAKFGPGDLRTVFAAARGTVGHTWGKRADAKLRKFSWEGGE